jgi:hypothetical protein
LNPNLAWGIEDYRIDVKFPGDITQHRSLHNDITPSANGVPLFLTQLAETLRLENTTEPLPENLIGSTAAKHGRELLAMGFTVSQVVHDYGDICLAVTELAVELHPQGHGVEAHGLHGGDPVY